MDNRVVVVLAVLISGCSSMNKIYPQEYSAGLQQRCLDKIENAGEDDERDCSLKAAQALQFAYRMYELRAETDFKDCQNKSVSEDATKLCFESVQKEHYDKHFGFNR